MVFPDDVSTDKTLANISLATQQYLQRYNLMPPSNLKGVATFSPVLEDQQEQDENLSPACTDSNTLDIQALKTLPKLTWRPVVNMFSSFLYF